MRRKSWKINTFSAEKYFFMKSILTRTFLKKTNYTSLFKQTVHPFNKSYIDFSGSNNPKGENHENNRAKEERKLPKTLVFFHVTSLSLFLDTTGTSFCTFSNINLFQKFNKTKAMILISLLHKTRSTKAIQFWMLDTASYKITLVRLSTKNASRIYRLG